MNNWNYIKYKGTHVIKHIDTHFTFFEKKQVIEKDENFI